MNKFLLSVVALLNPVWSRMGANIPQLMAILKVKLIMDDRRPNAYTQMRNQRKQKEGKGSSWMMLLLSFLMGFFYLFFFQLGTDPLLQMFIYCCAFMTMLMLTLISDFTYVLIDVKDNLVILPKPVNDRTVLLSRLLHIIIHVSKIIVPMALPAIVFLLVTKGILPAVAMIVMIMLASMFTIFMINALYLLALRFTSPEKFKEIINYLQIAFSTAVFAMYYLVPRFVNQSELGNVDLRPYKFLFVIPPYWFAGGWVSLSFGEWAPLYIILLVCSIFIPIFSLWVVVRKLAPSFNKRLSLIAGSGGESPSVAVPGNKSKFYRSLARLVAKDRTERMAFETVWLLTGRSREFKLKVYPSLAYVFIWFAYMLLTGRHGTPAEAWAALPGTKMYILLLYISCFAFVTAIAQLVYSSKFKASWVYYAAPLESPGKVLAGAFKATLMKFFMPFYLIICVFVIWVWGFKTLPDLALGLTNIISLCVLFAYVFMRKFPFSVEMNVQQTGGRFMMSLLALVVPGAFGFGHYLVVGSLVLQSIFLVLSIALCWLVFTSYRETDWKVIYKR
ncbi:hypothetical protein MKQ68_15395 [Chitinophaga horti]|uniref:ABC-2 type transport system permease protein n=1 Tax=Chitinophaga horti TaxID=2920382 RepID=A0ABY6IYJ5_9BACT|nr:hypothetical protein [Chitinophaga horti]UYQ91477.1 hypothetical protein MKQ68_15395 [Chitinophaga horti]